MYWFTADEHYGHANIIKFCNRPFDNVYEMDQEIIKRHNEVVSDGDIVVHAGDFAFRNKLSVDNYRTRLKGEHIFLKGSHDKWLKGDFFCGWSKQIEGRHIVVCHYAMVTWPKSHYNSWHLYGHSHGKLEGYVKGKCYDIGVDNNNFYPISLDQVTEIMKNKPDNFNLIRKE